MDRQGIDNTPKSELIDSMKNPPLMAAFANASTKDSKIARVPPREDGTLFEGAD